MKQKHPLLDAALSSLGIDSITPMQEASLNAAEDHDMVLLSPTGTGKTLAFLLPLLLRFESQASGVQALILAPSRELALQIESVFKAMNTPWKSCCCYGGHPVAEEKRQIAGNRPALIIGTPGRVADHLRKGNFGEVAGIRTLVIDEFDKSLELGFQEEMAEIIAQLSGLTRRVLLSATDMDVIPGFTGIRTPVTLNYLGGSEQQASRLQLVKLVSPAKDKIDTLYNLLCVLGNQSSIVFCNHRDAVDRVSKLLSERGLPNGAFHGGMEQPDRERALYKFRNGSCYALISTDLAARGLDIPEVEHIIHYHLPINEEAFTHRNGRTARWDAKGTSYLILNESEEPPGYLDGDLPAYALPDRIPKPASTRWATIYIGKGKKDKVNRVDVVGFLYKKGNLAKDDVGRVDVKEHYAFVAVRRTKLKQLLSLISGEKIKGMKTIIAEAE